MHNLKQSFRLSRIRKARRRNRMGQFMNEDLPQTARPCVETVLVCLYMKKRLSRRHYKIPPPPRTAWHRSTDTTEAYWHNRLHIKNNRINGMWIHIIQRCRSGLYEHSQYIDVIIMKDVVPEQQYLVHQKTRFIIVDVNSVLPVYHSGCQKCSQFSRLKQKWHFVTSHVSMY